MNRLLGATIVIALLAIGAGFAGYCVNRDASLHAAAARGDTLEWLRTDFHLTGSQLSAVRQLHEAYEGTCAEHCRLLREATRARQAVEAVHGDKAALDAADARVQAQRALCEEATTAHVRSVAALMAPEEGRRYLALVLPRIAGFDHAAAPDLQLGRSH